MFIIQTVHQLNYDRLRDFVKLIKSLHKYLPTPRQIREIRYLHIFGDGLKQNELWSFSRSSTAKGVAIGIFCAFLPMPFEMVPAIFMAIMLRGNLAFSIAGVWLSNPLTWVPLYTPCYLLGARILNIQPIPLDQVNLLDVGWHYVALWLGCLIIGVTVSFSVHFTITFLWRRQIRERWAARRKLRAARHLKSDK